jgi:hypothetical protein
MAASNQLSYTDWLENVRQGYGPSGQGAQSEKEVPVVWRDPNSGFGIGVAVDGNQVEKLVYFNPQGYKLRSSIFTAPELYKNASEFGIGLSQIGGLGAKLDAAGLKYKPGELYAGVGSNLGINFSDVQQGKLGSAYDWTQDPFASQKGPSASDQLAASQALADRLGIKRETSENLAQINPYVGPSGTRNFAVVVPSISGSPTISYYATQEEADAAKYLYGGTVYNLAETGGIRLESQPAQQQQTQTAQQQTQNLQQQTQTTQQQSPRTQQILSLLPADWSTYTPANKRFWFESKGVTRADLEAAGVPQTDITALYAQAAVEKKSNQATTGLLDTNNQTTNVTDQSTTGLLNTNNQTTNVTDQSTTGLLNANISLADASAVFQSLFGRAPTQQQLANFASIAANDPRLASRSAFEAYLRGTPDYLALQQTQQQQGLTNITQQQAIDTFKSIFGRVPNSSELANFLAYQRGSTPFTSTDALAAYLRSTPDFAAYQARQALPPMTYGRAVVPQSQLQYGYGPEQGLLTNIKGPTGQQIQNQMDAFYAASYGGTPTAGLLAPAIAQMANQQQPPNFYAMPTGAPSMQELTQRAQGLLDQGYTMADLRSQAMQNNLSPQVTGAILSNVQQGGATPYLQGLLSGELPLVAGQNLLAAR